MNGRGQEEKGGGRDMFEEETEGRGGDEGGWEGGKEQMMDVEG